MQFTPGAPGRAPAIAFSLRDASASAIMYAIATWPIDPGRQRQWLAVTYGRTIERIDDPPPHLRAADLARVQAEAVQTGLDAEALSAVSRDALRVRINAQLKAVGGYGLILDTPEWAKLSAEVVRVAAGPGRRVGELLLVLATMQQHHSNLPPSLNRAMAVVESFHSSPGRPAVVGTNEKALKDTWRDWKVIAPLWAALVLHENVVADTTIRPSDAYLDPVQRLCVLTAAAWFREFASTFRTVRAREPLISESDMLDIRTEATAEEPDLPPLPGRLLAVAERYSVKAVKQGY